MTTDSRLVLDVTSDRQRFYDEAMWVEVSKARPLSLAINRGLASSKPGATKGPSLRPVIRDITHYERVQIRWMKPDGRGGLVPRSHD